MKKVYSFLLTMFFLFTFALNVDARTYGKPDVEATLNRIKDSYVNSSALPAGTTFTVESSDTETVITSSYGGRSFVSHFVYNNGVYSFTSVQDAVTNATEYVTIGFENFNISFLLSAIYSTYDQETIQSVADVVLSDTRHVDRFTLEKDGLATTLIPMEFNPSASEENVTMGFIKAIAMDINHPNFIKWVSDNDGELILQYSFAKYDDKDVLSFDPVINDGQPIIEGTPNAQVPIKITEHYRDGTSAMKTATMANVEQTLGYKITDFSTATVGSFSANVSRIPTNSDDSRPEDKKASYTVVKDPNAGAKDVLSFEPVINDGLPIIKGTPREEVPIKITEKLRDGSTVEKTSTIGDIEKELGYKVDEFSTDDAGEFTAKVTRVISNSDGSIPEERPADYQVVPVDSGDGKDVIDFEVIINDNKPILEGTPDNQVPVKIIEHYRDGTTGEKLSTISKSENSIGYKIEEFSTGAEGNFTAKVTRIIENSDGSRPGQKKPAYRVIANSKPVVENPKTGVGTYGLVFAFVGLSAGAVVVFKKRNFFRKL